jgi:DNA polymerase I-like protein with 3'-5' exonuclease and polymerase domains
LFQIEKNGLYTNYEQFNKKFSDTPLYDGFAFSEYNVYTTTGRPSNRFGGINFAALNKENGQRASFVSRFGENGFILSYDYDAYHLRLLAELVDYKFPDNISVHEYLGKFYFSKEELSPAEYSESKSISFRQLYGGIGQDYLEIPFFYKVHEYTQLLWEQFRRDGYIETPMFGRKLFKSFFSEMNAAKLLNYLLQSFESERNMAVIHNILLRTQSYSSKLILYTYDSFLWDFDKRDGAMLIKLIKEELTQNGKFPVKLEIGPDYHNMIDVKRHV